MLRRAARAALRRVPPNDLLGVMLLTHCVTQITNPNGADTHPDGNRSKKALGDVAIA
jgi:hypothetical protein